MKIFPFIGGIFVAMSVGFAFEAGNYGSAITCGLLFVWFLADQLIEAYKEKQ
jgi:hypothetical protein